MGFWGLFTDFISLLLFLNLMLWVTTCSMKVSLSTLLFSQFVVIDQSWRFLPGCRKTDFPRGIKGWAKPSWPLSGPHRDQRFWMGSRGTEFGQGTDTVLSEVHWTLPWSAELRKPRLTRHQMVIFNRRYQDPWGQKESSRPGWELLLVSLTFYSQNRIFLTLSLWHNTVPPSYFKASWDRYSSSLGQWLRAWV